MTIPETLQHADLATILPSQPAWLQQGVQFLCMHGSHAYGTATATSDVDLKGWAVPPRSYFTGFAQSYAQTITNKPYDLCIFDVRKFFQLASHGNPGLLEILYVDADDILYASWPATLVRQKRDLFLSRKIQATFGGYAYGQMQRIETHRRWLRAPPTHQPTRAEFDLPDRPHMSKDQLGAAMASVQKMVDSWEFDLSDLDEARRITLLENIRRVLDERTTTPAHEQAGRLLGFDDNLLAYVKSEQAYQQAARTWAQYGEWKAKRNPTRAAMEAAHGFDCKHAMHTARLTRMCREILTTGQVHVKRPDAEELLAIKNGAWTYEQLREFFDREHAALPELARNSALPDTPPILELDALCQTVVGTAVY